VEHQDDSLDRVRRDQSATFGAEPIGAYELGTTRDERPSTSWHVKAIIVVDGQMALEELIDFLLKSPV
jgi:hypothetical protein